MGLRVCEETKRDSHGSTSERKVDQKSGGWLHDRYMEREGSDALLFEGEEIEVEKPAMPAACL